MHRTTCTECGGALEVGFTADRGGSHEPRVSYWVQGEPEELRVLGMATDTINVHHRPRFDIVTYRCRACGLLLSYAPADRPHS
jgi:hypothetical protein